MNPIPTVDNDLQKAIDDITKTTNQDPVFADPVAAPSSVPEGDTGELAESVGPFPAPAPAMPEPTTLEPVMPEPVTPPNSVTSDSLNIREVKAAALRDLAPLVGKMNLNASQKFNLYRDMFESLRDYTVIEPAYQAAKDIIDEHERGEALLYLVNSIDNM